MKTKTTPNTETLWTDAPISSDLRTMMWPLNQIRPRKNQMRQKWVPQDIEELGGSIREMRALGLGLGTGILQPIVVRFDPTSFRADGSIKSDAMADIVFGEKRYRAAFLAGLTNADHVPIISEDANRDVMRAAGLHENIHRGGADPFDVARELQLMQNAEKLTIEQLTQRMRKPKSWVQQHLDLLRVGEDARPLIDEMPNSVDTAIRINTVKEPTLRALLIQMRLAGVVLDVIEVFIPIKNAPQPLRGTLIVWAQKLWQSARKRGEPLEVEAVKTALRNEARTYGFVLERGLKNFEWRPLQVESVPVLNQSGEVTGHTPTSPAATNDNGSSGATPPPTLPAPAIQNAPSLSSQWQQLATNREGRTVTVPQLNPREVLTGVGVQLSNLTFALRGVETVPDAKGALAKLSELEKQLSEVRDALESRFSQDFRNLAKNP